MQEEDDFRRRDDRIAARTEQKLEDFILESRKWMETHDHSAKEWRFLIEEELKNLKLFNQKLDTPVKIFSWAVVIILGAVFTAVGLKFFHWLDR